MSWRTSQTIKDLKELGTFAEVKSQVQKAIRAYDFPPRVQISTAVNSWKKLQELIDSFLIIELAFSSKPNGNSVPDAFFQSEDARIIFALTELEGKQRNRQLGISDPLYQNKKAAQKWRNDLMKVIHPDHPNAHPLATDAAQNLNEIYEFMIS